ncbi:MAG TPA: hypothetical protein VKA09_06380 [Nitrososphaeraceae archaeon]|nr:hypothetical protein [Nitrososphaeraceae archaeon]
MSYKNTVLGDSQYHLSYLLPSFLAEKIESDFVRIPPYSSQICLGHRSTTHQHIFKNIQYSDGTRRQRVFRRDCLEVDLKKDNKILPIFVCHFKSMSGGRDTTRPIPQAEATTVREILEDRFGDPSTHDWVLAGDLNDYTETDGIPDQIMVLTLYYRTVLVLTL